MESSGHNIPMAPPTGVVTGQPSWMVKPASNLGCPPGLEYLTQLDQVLVHQQVELFEAMTGIETKNKYAIKNSLGQQCYFAYEESEFCHRLCCGSERGFDMHIVDNLGQEVIRVHREFKCCAGCCWCVSGDTCAYTIDVEAPVGTKIGRIVQQCSFWKPRYGVQNTQHQTIMNIKGPCCVCSGPCCTSDTPFEVFSADGSKHLATIARQFGGFTKEMFTDATNFGIQFPMDMDVKEKALLLGATFLIDMMWFEHDDDDN